MLYATPAVITAAHNPGTSQIQAAVETQKGRRIWPRIWIASVTPFEAAVFSQTLITAAEDAANDSCLWRLDPEVGMRLNVEPEARIASDIAESHLARLIASMLAAARAGGRFDYLVTLANPPAREGLRRHLNAMTRACIVRELAAPADTSVTEIVTSLRCACPDLFG